jgi:hypothetical protein
LFCSWLGQENEKEASTTTSFAGHHPSHHSNVLRNMENIYNERESKALNLENRLKSLLVL